MKSYTDLQQSKKLAEILSPESADMIIVSIGDREGVVTTTMPKEIFNMLKTPFTDVRNTVPCWSLAALYNVLPITYINNDNEVCGPLHIDITDCQNPFLLWYVNPLHKGSIVELKTKEYDNMIDACVEMIIKLHEQKLL